MKSSNCESCKNRAICSKAGEVNELVNTLLNELEKHNDLPISAYLICEYYSPKYGELED